MIFLDKKDGSRLECLIDTSDLSKVMDFPNKWLDCWSPGGRTHYVRGNIRVNGKKTSVILSRYLLDAPKGMHVDHINHDTLDNRRSNLRLVSPEQNGQNKKGARIDSKSGHRNVVWRKDAQKWCIYMKLNGKTRNFGLYKNLDDAVMAAERIRASLMPYSMEARIGGGLN